MPMKIRDILGFVWLPRFWCASNEVSLIPEEMIPHRVGNLPVVQIEPRGKDFEDRGDRGEPIESDGPKRVQLNSREEPTTKFLIGLRIRARHRGLAAFL